MWDDCSMHEHIEVAGTPTALTMLIPQAFLWLFIIIMRCNSKVLYNSLPTQKPTFTFPEWTFIQKPKNCLVPGRFMVENGLINPFFHSIKNF